MKGSQEYLNGSAEGAGAVPLRFNPASLDLVLERKLLENKIRKEKKKRTKRRQNGSSSSESLAEGREDTPVSSTSSSDSSESDIEQDVSYVYCGMPIRLSSPEEEEKFRHMFKVFRLSEDYWKSSEEFYYLINHPMSAQSVTQCDPITYYLASWSRKPVNEVIKVLKTQSPYEVIRDLIRHWKHDEYTPWPDLFPLPFFERCYGFILLKNIYNLVHNDEAHFLFVTLLCMLKSFKDQFDERNFIYPEINEPFFDHENMSDETLANLYYPRPLSPPDEEPVSESVSGSTPTIGTPPAKPSSSPEASQSVFPAKMPGVPATISAAALQASSSPEASQSFFPRVMPGTTPTIGVPPAKPSSSPEASQSIFSAKMPGVPATVSAAALQPLVEKKARSSDQTHQTPKQQATQPAKASSSKKKHKNKSSRKNHTTPPSSVKEEAPYDPAPPSSVKLPAPPSSVKLPATIENLPDDTDFSGVDIILDEGVVSWDFDEDGQLVQLPSPGNGWSVDPHIKILPEHREMVLQAHRNAQKLRREHLDKKRDQQTPKTSNSKNGGPIVGASSDEKSKRRTSDTSNQSEEEFHDAISDEANFTPPQKGTAKPNSTLSSPEHTTNQGRSASKTTQPPNRKNRREGFDKLLSSLEGDIAQTKHKKESALLGAEKDPEVKSDSNLAGFSSHHDTYTDKLEGKAPEGSLFKPLLPGELGSFLALLGKPAIDDYFVFQMTDPRAIQPIAKNSIRVNEASILSQRGLLRYLPNKQTFEAMVSFFDEEEQALFLQGTKVDKQWFEGLMKYFRDHKSQANSKDKGHNQTRDSNKKDDKEITANDEYWEFASDDLRFFPMQIDRFRYFVQKSSCNEIQDDRLVVRTRLSPFTHKLSDDLIPSTFISLPLNLAALYSLKGKIRFHRDQKDFQCCMPEMVKSSLVKDIPKKLLVVTLKGKEMENFMQLVNNIFLSRSKEYFVPVIWRESLDKKSQAHVVDMSCLDISKFLNAGVLRSNRVLGMFEFVSFLDPIKPKENFDVSVDAFDDISYITYNEFGKARIHEYMQFSFASAFRDFGVTPGLLFNYNLAFKGAKASKYRPFTELSLRRFLKDNYDSDSLYLPVKVQRVYQHDFLDYIMLPMLNAIPFSLASSLVMDNKMLKWDKRTKIFELLDFCANGKLIDHGIVSTETKEPPQASILREFFGLDKHLQIYYDARAKLLEWCILMGDTKDQKLPVIFRDSEDVPRISVVFEVNLEFAAELMDDHVILWNYPAQALEFVTAGVVSTSTGYNVIGNFYTHRNYQPTPMVRLRRFYEKSKVVFPSNYRSFKRSKVIDDLRREVKGLEQNSTGSTPDKSGNDGLGSFQQYIKTMLAQAGMDGPDAPVEKSKSDEKRDTPQSSSAREPKIQKSPPAEKASSKKSKSKKSQTGSQAGSSPSPETDKSSSTSSLQSSQGGTPSCGDTAKSFSKRKEKCKVTTPSDQTTEMLKPSDQTTEMLKHSDQTAEKLKHGDQTAEKLKHSDQTAEKRKPSSRNVMSSDKPEQVRTTLKQLKNKDLAESPSSKETEKSQSDLSSNSSEQTSQTRENLEAPDAEKLEINSASGLEDDSENPTSTPHDEKSDILFHQQLEEAIAMSQEEENNDMNFQSLVSVLQDLFPEIPLSEIQVRLRTSPDIDVIIEDLFLEKDQAFSFEDVDFGDEGFDIKLQEQIQRGFFDQAAIRNDYPEAVLTLKDMFPDYDLDILSQVYEEHHHDAEIVAEQILMGAVAKFDTIEHDTQKELNSSEAQQQNRVKEEEYFKRNLARLALVTGIREVRLSKFLKRNSNNFVGTLIDVICNFKSTTTSVGAKSGRVQRGRSSAGNNNTRQLSRKPLKSRNYEFKETSTEARELKSIYESNDEFQKMNWNFFKRALIFFGGDHGKVNEVAFIIHEHDAAALTYGSKEDQTQWNTGPSAAQVIEASVGRSNSGVPNRPPAITSLPASTPASSSFGGFKLTTGGEIDMKAKYKRMSDMLMARMNQTKDKKISSYYQDVNREVRAKLRSELSREDDIRRSRAIDSWSSTGILDLHHLSVKSAMSAVIECLKDWWQEEMNNREIEGKVDKYGARAEFVGPMKIITGRGLHSVDGVSKVRISTLAYLQNAGYVFDEASGSFVVRGCKKIRS